MQSFVLINFQCTLGAALWASVKAQIVSVPSIVRLPACATVLSLGNVTLVAWVTSIVGFTCMMMTLYKHISALGFSWRSRSQMSPLLRTIIRDGVLYWFLIFAADLFDALLTLDTHTPITRVGAIWFIVVYSIAGTRILLNLRAEAQKSILGSRGSTTQPTEGSLELERVLAALAGALEGHVLEEVGRSVRLVRLRTRTGIDPDTNRSSLSMRMRFCRDCQAIWEGGELGGRTVDHRGERPQWADRPLSMSQHLRLKLWNAHNVPVDELREESALKKW
ncbi:hypothetical protein NM688_g4725 [Phlebia brevispora]|uniref:Uncharacterized protein n=1 Tax=Phlebia brevispora TaxID=194682 RepID=A0ACC1T2E5_9APHY|nr:hypothetical protein NM688_g4725 [Phlebia brevispora]